MTAQAEQTEVGEIALTPGQSIITGLQEAIAWSRGEAVPVRKTVVHVPNVDIQQMRRKMQLSQDEFAAKFGFASASIRNWEQGRRRPEGPARVLLAIIERHPEIVEEILASNRAGTNEGPGFNDQNPGNVE